jgi:hypothetical protein
MCCLVPRVAASCTGPVTVPDGTFTCTTTLSGQTCAGSCNTGYSGTPVATCFNGVYTVSGSCQPGKVVWREASAFLLVHPERHFVLCIAACAPTWVSACMQATQVTYCTASRLKLWAALPCHSRHVTASCSGPVTVSNGNFSCGTTLSGQTCTGSCNSGYSGTPLASCTNGVYTVSGSCQPGEEMLCV